MNVVQYLPERRADVKSSNNNGHTALHRCVIVHAHHELARLLLEHGASVTAMDQNGVTALHMAVRRRYFRMARLFLKYGADANQRFLDGSTMLHYCVLRRDCSSIKIMQVLLESGANTKLANREGKVPLLLHGRTVELALSTSSCKKSLEMGQFGSFVVEREVKEQPFPSCVRSKGGS